MDEPCDNYACTPSESVPSQTVIVHQPTPDFLAVTGTDPLISAALIGAFLIVFGVWSMLKGRESRDD